MDDHALPRRLQSGLGVMPPKLMIFLGIEAEKRINWKDFSSQAALRTCEHSSTSSLKAHMMHDKRLLVGCKVFLPSRI
jgi:hypothetical protein